MAAWKMDTTGDEPPSWASDGSADSLHMFVHNCLKLLGTLLFILGSIAAQPLATRQQGARSERAA